LGEFFAFWPVGQLFFENDKGSAKFGLLVNNIKFIYVLILTKKIGVYYILGDFVTNSSGHPAKRLGQRPVLKSSCGQRSLTAPFD
jgi:hypothetical protein